MGGDGTYNLYLTGGGPSDPFINSGNTNPAARINVPLATGIHTFSMLGDWTPFPWNSGYWGLNLFFDGNDTTPRISVFAPINWSAFPPHPAFSANSVVSTPTLDYSAVVPASGTLIYSDGSYVVSLVDYYWSDPTVYLLNRVGPFDNVPQNSGDFVGQFTLSVESAVAPVPEPATMLLLGSGLLGLGGARWRKGRAKKPTI